MPNMKALALTVWDKKIYKDFLLHLFCEIPDPRTFSHQGHNLKYFGRGIPNIKAIALTIWDKNIFKLLLSVAMATRGLNGIQIFEVF